MMKKSPLLASVVYFLFAVLISYLSFGFSLVGSVIVIVPVVAYLLYFVASRTVFLVTEKDWLYPLPIIGGLLFAIVLFTSNIMIFVYGLFLNILLVYLFIALLSVMIPQRDTLREDALEAVIENYMKEQVIRARELHELERNLVAMQAKLNKKVARKPRALKQDLQGIEDKCKAMNFSIGRVYGKRNGGSKAMREMLRFDSSLYNMFSEIVKDNKVTKEELKDFLSVLRKIKKQAQVLNKKEQDLFTKREMSKLKVTRRKDGSQRVIQVLHKNDNDPVKLTNKEIITICTNLLRKYRKK